MLAIASSAALAVNPNFSATTSIVSTAGTAAAKNGQYAMKYQYETDPEVLAAVAALPQAQTLLNTASQARAQKAQK